MQIKTKEGGSSILQVFYSKRYKNTTKNQDEIKWQGINSTCWITACSELCKEFFLEAIGRAIQKR